MTDKSMFRMQGSRKEPNCSTFYNEIFADISLYISLWPLERKTTYAGKHITILYTIAVDRTQHFSFKGCIVINVDPLFTSRVFSCLVLSK